MTKYLAAAVQYEPVHGDKAYNLRALESAVREAADRGARLIVTSEMATVGLCWSSRSEIAPYVEPVPGPMFEHFAALARELDVYIAVGMAEVDPATDMYYNAAFLVGPQGLTGQHRKVHSFMSEPLWATDGDLGFQVWDTPLGRLGMMICMDANYPESSLLLAQQKADVILLPANWTVETCPAPLWMTRAHDSEAYVVCANRWGEERGFTFSGGSTVIGPDGSIVATTGREQADQIVYGEIDLAWSNSQRGCLPTARRELYRALSLNRFGWNPTLMHQHFGDSPLPAPSALQLVSVDLAPAGHSASDIFAALEDNFIGLDGPSLIVLPEYSFTGAVETAEQAASVAEPLDGPTAHELAEWCARTGNIVVAGIVERDGAALFSTLILVGPDGLITHYRKTHLAESERAFLTAGDQLVWADTSVGRIGLLAGTDLQRPEPVRALAIEGVDVVCAAASPGFPSPLTQQAANIPSGDATIHWHLARVRAAENDVYVAYANRDGSSGIFFGPILLDAPAAEAWPERVNESMGLARLQIDADLSLLRAKPSLRRRLPSVYAPLQRLG